MGGEGDRMGWSAEGRRNDYQTQGDEEGEKRELVSDGGQQRSSSTATPVLCFRLRWLTIHGKGSYVSACTDKKTNTTMRQRERTG